MIKTIKKFVKTWRNSFNTFSLNVWYRWFRGPPPFKSINVFFLHFFNAYSQKKKENKYFSHHISGKNMKNTCELDDSSWCLKIKGAVARQVGPFVQNRHNLCFPKTGIIWVFADLTSFVSADDVEVCDILPPISLSCKSSHHQRRILRKHKATIFSNSSRFVQLSNHGKTRQQRSM